MSLANVNVGDLGEFISTLQGFNSQLEGNWSQLKARWEASSDTWQDIKKDQFTGAIGWDEVIRMMENYLTTSDEYLNFLKRLEDRAQDYLNA